MWVDKTPFGRFFYHRINNGLAGNFKCNFILFYRELKNKIKKTLKFYKSNCPSFDNIFLSILKSTIKPSFCLE